MAATLIKSERNQSPRLGRFVTGGSSRQHSQPDKAVLKKAFALRLSRSAAGEHSGKSGSFGPFVEYRPNGVKSIISSDIIGITLKEFIRVVCVANPVANLRI